MARFYADENFPLPVVECLRRLGHDVLTAFEAGRAEREIPDEDVLSFAHDENRAVLTLDRRDFIQLHAAQPIHGGIIVCTFDPKWESQVERINQAVSQSADLAGQLVRVNRPP